MELLKRGSAPGRALGLGLSLTVSLTVSMMTLAGCGLSSTRTDYLETDTYISSSDSANHADLTYLNVSKTAALEERTVFKIPTGSGSQDTNLTDSLKDPLNVIFFPFFVIVDIIADLFNCQGKALAATLLTNAKLVFDVTGNGEGTLAGKMNLKLLSKPWWQNASWLRAHTFSSKGNWATAGGDFDSSFTTVASADGTGSSPTLEFDVTTYFKALLATPNTVHYGMVIGASGAGLAAVALASTQFASQGRRPRLVSTYNCISPTATDEEFAEARARAVPYAHALGAPEGESR